MILHAIKIVVVIWVGMTVVRVCTHKSSTAIRAIITTQIIVHQVVLAYTNHNIPYTLLDTLPFVV